MSVDNKRELLEKYFAEADLWEFDQAISDVAVYADLGQINYMEDIDEYSPSKLFALDHSQFDINDSYFIISDGAIVSYCWWFEAAEDCLDDIIDWLVINGDKYNGESESLYALLHSAEYNGVDRKYCSNCKKHKCRCDNCDSLIDSGLVWYCKYFDNYCSEIGYCDYWEKEETGCEFWEKKRGEI